MTIVVGYLPHKGGRGALDLGLQLAHALGEPLTVVTVVPRQWSTPSLAKVDADHADYARQVGEYAQARAREYLHDSTVDVAITYHTISGRSTSTALLDLAEDEAVSMLVLGSSTDGAEGRISIGATTGKLLHSSPIPLALSPRGYRSTARDGVPRLTCAYSDNEASDRVAVDVAVLAAAIAAPLRIASFGIRGATMYPPEVGVSAEDAVLASWQGQAATAQRHLRDSGLIGDDVDLVIGTGPGWSEALSSIDWKPTEILALGSSTTGRIARVFLGSRATKLIRHSPVPVLIIPGQGA